MAQRRRIVVTGRVQGVGFRWFARECAERLSLTGWAHNTTDGSVEVEVEGKPEALEEFVELLRRGPRSCSVDALDQDEIPVQGGDSFGIV